MESFTLGLMRGDGAPLYRQIYHHIVEEIASGGLAAGEKLPSKRRLAADLRVSVSTVETAYQMLVAEGYIAARAKSGASGPCAPRRAEPKTALHKTLF